jgi:chemotaxis protein methyltransferase CheR
VTISAGAFSFVSDLLQQHAAIVLSPGKEYLVESRLLPLARQIGLDDVGALVARLQTRPDDNLRRQIVEAMTTNETSFFRDRDPFNAFSQAILPDLCKERSASPRLNVWSAACSSGQEPYSIAMSIVDHPLITCDWQVEVLATDLNEEMLERARQARYSQLEVNRGLPVAMLVRHFERAETDWRVVPAVRGMVRFKQLNLAEAFDLPQMDVIFLRNVLIYFNPTTKVEVLKRVRRILRPDGYLFLGGAETTLGLDDEFERVMVGSTTAYRHKGARPLEMPSRLSAAVAGAGLSALPTPGSTLGPSPGSTLRGAGQATHPPTPLAWPFQASVNNSISSQGRR